MAGIFIGGMGTGALLTFAALAALAAVMGNGNRR